MKLLFDLFPVIVFFIAYFLAGRSPEAAAHLTGTLLGDLGLGSDVTVKQAPILLATALAIVATVGQVLFLLARGKKVDKMLWIGLAIIVVMGGATLILRDATFIMWKPTVLYWAFAAVLLGARLLFRKNLMQAMMGKQLELPESVWSGVNLSWAGFFLVMGALNLLVAFNFSEQTWVTFKLFGGMGLMLVFAIGQGLILSRYMPDHEEEKK
ncbi:MAG: septation protein A [Burkholderiales bacterium]|nr:septation protein A [Burkholderiales bacterium]